jgi:hypothetical protein
MAYDVDEGAQALLLTACQKHSLPGYVAAVS